MEKVWGKNADGRTFGRRTFSWRKFGGETLGTWT